MESTRGVRSFVTDASCDVAVCKCEGLCLEGFAERAVRPGTSLAPLSVYSILQPSNQIMKADESLSKGVGRLCSAGQVGRSMRHTPTSSAWRSVFRSDHASDSVWEATDSQSAPGAVLPPLLLSVAPVLFFKRTR